MACLRCPLVVASGQLDLAPSILEAEPALNLLCVDHFRDFKAERAARDARELRESLRTWCACGRELYLQTPGRVTCEACRLGMAPPAPVEPDWKPSAVAGANAPVLGARATCYGSKGQCRNPGGLHASGVWCSEHAPNPFPGRS
jgi:hypothetical protein